MKFMSRRSFLSRASGAGLVAATTVWSTRLARSSPLGKPVGLQLYAVGDALQRDAAGTLNTLREIGYREVETAGFGKLSAREFRQLLDSCGMACPSAHLPFDENHLDSTFADAHALGARFATSGSLRGYVVPQLKDFWAPMTLDEAKRTAELANRIGEKARMAGLQYVYHNHNFEFAETSGGTAYDVLLHETDRELVKFEIDCGWMTLGGRNPVDYFKKHPGRFPMIHVKDFLPASSPAVGQGVASLHPGAELGHGIIDYRPIFLAAGAAGLQHYFVEQEGPFSRMSQVDAARQAYLYLRSID